MEKQPMIDLFDKITEGIKAVKEIERIYEKEEVRLCETRVQIFTGISKIAKCLGVETETFTRDSKDNPFETKFRYKDCNFIQIHEDEEAD